MVLETTKEWYKNRTGDSEFKRFHWWEAVRYQLKWRAKSASFSITDPWVSSSDCMSDEEVTRPMCRDRAKAATRKGKGMEGSCSQSEFFSAVGGMMSTLKKLITSFAKVRLWKQWNKLKDHSTANMDEEDLQTHREALKLIQKELQFAQTNEVVIEDK
jgi:hypothetical protein